MRRVRFSPAAQSDLSHIWDYTLLNWGEDQAEKYLRKIEKACGEIASEHNRGVSAAHIRTGYRKVSVGSHMLFFRLDGENLEIVRILHQRMDIPTQLDE
jgi:toxin ParE1/3/4